MSVRRKRGDLGTGLGVDRLLGVAGIQKIGGDTVYNGNPSATTKVISHSAGVAGDLLVALMWKRGAVSASSPSSSGLTFVDIKGGDSVGNSVYAWYAWMPDATVRNITFTIGSTTEIVCLTRVYRGVDPATVLDVSASSAALASSTTQTVPGLTTSTAGALALAMWMGGDDNTPTQPADVWADDYSENMVTYASAVLASKVTPTAAATGDLVITETTNGPDGGNYCTFALRPLLP